LGTKKCELTALFLFEVIKHLFSSAYPVTENIEKGVILGSSESAFYHEARHVAAAVSCGKPQ
jgi:hypothetical protein